MHKKWHHAHLRLSLPVAQSTSEPQLQGKLPPKEPRHRNLKSPRSHRDSATAAMASFGEILMMLQHSKLCISIPSWAVFCSSAGLVLPQPGEAQGQQLCYPRRSSCSCTGTAGIFLCLPKFFSSSLLPLEESLGFQGKCNSPWFKVVFH